MQVLEQSKPEVFSPVSFFDARTRYVTAPRWVWFPGDLIVPARKAEISWLAVGGEETPSPCLQRYGRGFVPRGRAAILEQGGEPIPMAHLGELQSVAWQGIVLDGEAVKNKMGVIPVFPGDGLRVLKRYAMNPIRNGLDEITVLAGKSWDECHDQDGTGILDFIEQAQFGDGIEPTLRGLENQIRHAVVNDARIDYGKMREEQLKMCEDFRNWGEQKVAVDNGLLQLGTIPVRPTSALPEGSLGGWAYTLSPLANLLIAQLELKRQDQPIQEMSNMVSQILAQHQPQSSGMSAADLDLIEQRMEARLAKAREADAQRIAELEAKLANVSRETFACEGCGQECASKAGKMAHERHCDAMNKLVNPHEE